MVSHTSEPYSCVPLYCEAVNSTCIVSFYICDMLALPSAISALPTFSFHKQPSAVQPASMCCKEWHTITFTLGCKPHSWWIDLEPNCKLKNEKGHPALTRQQLVSDEREKCRRPQCSRCSKAEQDLKTYVLALRLQSYLHCQCKSTVKMMITVGTRLGKSIGAVSRGLRGFLI